MTEKSTIDREYAPLLKVKDNFPKYVLTTDNNWHDTSYQPNNLITYNLTAHYSPLPSVSKTGFKIFRYAPAFES